MSLGDAVRLRLPLGRHCRAAGSRLKGTTMSTFILIFSLYASAWADNDFASIRSQEFSSQETCEAAKAEFLKKFETARSTNTQAICVKK